MKPFNLEQAKAGKSVCTKDGRRVRLLCFDRVDILSYPICGLVEMNGLESVYSWSVKGKYYSPGDSDLDLVMQPCSGWINIYPVDNQVSKYLWPTEKLARENCGDEGITIKIEW